MRRAAGMVVAAALAVAGCGGGGSSASGTGGHAAGQGGSGGSGSGGSGAGSGTGGHAGAVGGGGAGGSVATGGGSGALPTCPIVAPPSDPDGGLAVTDTCNSLTVPATSISATGLAPIDGGVVLDGGVTASPAGGTILDGDYQLVRWMNNPDDGETTTQRALRVFEGGAYIEWAVKQPDNQVVSGSTDNLRYNTRATVSGHTMTFSLTCGVGVIMPSYDYTASGDLLAFFAYGEDYTTGQLGYLSLDTYQRTCTRP